MPASDSATCAVSAEMRVRTSANAVCERIWNQRATTSVGGRITIVASASRQSRIASAIIAPVSVSDVADERREALARARRRARRRRS